MRNKTLDRIAIAYVWWWILLHSVASWAVVLKSVYLGTIWWPFDNHLTMAAFVMGAFFLILAYARLSREGER